MQPTQSTLREIKRVREGLEQLADSQQKIFVSMLVSLQIYQQSLASLELELESQKKALFPDDHLIGDRDITTNDPYVRSHELFGEDRLVA